MALTLLSYLRELKDDDPLSEDEFYQLVEKSMLAFQAGGAGRPELVLNRTITTVINTAGKFAAKDRTCVRGTGGKVIGLSYWLSHFGFTATLQSGKEIGMLNVNVVLNLFIQCSDTAIAGYLSSIMPYVAIHAELEAIMIAKYGKHRL